MGWLIALAVIAFLAFLPLGVGAKYDTDGALVWLIIGPFKKRLLSPDKEKKKSAEKKQQSADPQASSSEKKKGGNLSDFMPLWNIILEFLGGIRRKLCVRKLEVFLLMAGDDPCDLAQNYGKACAAVAALEPQLERFLRFKDKQLQVECDFLENKSKIWVRVEVVISLGRLLILSSHHGFRALKAYMKIMNKGKGGAQV